MRRTIIAILILIVLGAGAYAVFHKSKAPAATSNTNSSQVSTPASPGAVIQTKTASGVGTYLADSKGNALYTYGADTNGVSNCSGSCLNTWPIYEVTTTSNLPANVSVITRSDGTKQYAYKGMPLYTFTSDSVGHVTGDNVSDFHIAKP